MIENIDVFIGDNCLFFNELNEEDATTKKQEPKRIGRKYFKDKAKDKNTGFVAGDISGRILSDCIIIPPLGRLLASTSEQVGSTVSWINSEMKCRSTFARHGLTVCSCAGHGDPGYHNHWTLEIQNLNSYPVLLKRGYKVAQIVFHNVIGCGDNLYSSKYNNDGKLKDSYTDFERFNMMIPKSI
jgi:deoxycytidine triphosphate deaminase